MLSICIALFNFDAKPLVNELIAQIRNDNLPAEIIVRDDGSDSSFLKLNSILHDFEEVTFIEGKNIGRSANRNAMAEMAKFDYLLFLDADSIPENSFFLKNYITDIQSNAVICGGTSYQNKKPNNEQLLRWHYGKHREYRTADERNRNMWKSFSSFNFQIPKSVFQSIKFDEQITKYGHEDSLFGIELKNRNIPVFHINNYLIHLGLESNLIFLQKTHQSIENLLNIAQIKPYISTEIKLLSTFIKIKKSPTPTLLAYMYELCGKQIENQLCSKKPSLFLFDVYKLAFLCYLVKSKS